MKTPCRKVAVPSSSSVLGYALAGLLAAGFAASPAGAATTAYTSAYSGGTIAPGDTVLLNNGATVTGSVTANGTLQFNQSATTLTIAGNAIGTLNATGGSVTNTMGYIGANATGVGVATVSSGTWATSGT